MKLSFIIVTVCLVLLQAFQVSALEVQLPRPIIDTHDTIEYIILLDSLPEQPLQASVFIELSPDFLILLDTYQLESIKTHKILEFNIDTIVATNPHIPNGMTFLGSKKIVIQVEQSDGFILSAKASLDIKQKSVMLFLLQILFGTISILLIIAAIVKAIQKPVDHTLDVLPDFDTLPQSGCKVGYVADTESIAFVSRMQLTKPIAFVADSQNHWKVLVEELVHQKIKVIIVDTLADTSGFCEKATKAQTEKFHEFHMPSSSAKPLGAIICDKPTLAHDALLTIIEAKKYEETMEKILVELAGLPHTDEITTVVFFPHVDLLLTTKKGELLFKKLMASIPYYEEHGTGIVFSITDMQLAYKFFHKLDMTFFVGNIQDHTVSFFSQYAKRLATLRSEEMLAFSQYNKKIPYIIRFRPTFCSNIPLEGSHKRLRIAFAKKILQLKDKQALQHAVHLLSHGHFHELERFLQGVMPKTMIQ